jgi:hypothetical protein
MRSPVLAAARPVGPGAIHPVREIPLRTEAWAVVEEAVGRAVYIRIPVR